MIRMSLCPNCRTIQKRGTNCSICKCPVNPLPEHPELKEGPKAVALLAPPNFFKKTTRNTPDVRR